MKRFSIRSRAELLPSYSRSSSNVGEPNWGPWMGRGTNFAPIIIIIVIIMLNISAEEDTSRTLGDSETMFYSCGEVFALTCANSCYFRIWAFIFLLKHVHSLKTFMSHVNELKRTFLQTGVSLILNHFVTSSVRAMCCLQGNSGKFQIAWDRNDNSIMALEFWKKYINIITDSLKQW